MTEKNRIEPIENPKGILSKIAYRMLIKQFWKVINSRYPSMFMWVKKMSDIEQHQIKVETDLKLLVKYYVAYLNGCAYCLDIGEKLAQKRNISTEKYYAVANFRNDDS